MKKIINSIYSLLAGSLLLTSCSVNDLPTFDDKDAFVSFVNATMSIDENAAGGELNIPVLLTSLAGLEGTVDFEIVDGTAVLGEDFELMNSGTALQFTKEAPTQYITIRALDNDVFGGDISFTINLKASENGVNLGDSQTCTVSIIDDEHPLAAILGTYNGVGESYFGGALSWTLTLEKDAEDVSVVWINNMVPGGSALAVYGIVNDEMTEIRIPVNQELAANQAQLTGLDPLTEDYMEVGSYIIGEIANGTITINNAMYGSEAVTDGVSQGFYEIVLPGSVWTKQ